MKPLFKLTPLAALLATFYSHASFAPDDLPIPNLPAEAKAILLPDSAPPESDSSNYISQSNEVIGNMLHNGTQKDVRKVKISGKQLVFAQGHLNKLYENYENTQDVKELVLYAEELVIKNPLHLPQTNVTIYARRIKFEGGGMISTTPSAKPADISVVSGVGENGYSAGNITVYAENVTNTTGKTVLQMDGVKGGMGGTGKPGDNGVNRAQVDGGPAPFAGHTTYRNDKWSDCNFFGSCSTSESFEGVQVKPDNGKDAIAPSMAGLGGNAGNLISNLPINSFVFSSLAGANGDKRPAQLGGNVGNPNPIYWVVHNRAGGNSWYVWPNGGGPFYGQNGTDASAPEQTGKAKPGAYSTSGHQFSWFHPKMLRPIVDYVKDTYLHSRNMPAAQAVISEYLALLDSYQVSPNWNKMVDPFEAAELLQMASELRTLSFRIDSNLDYFGNPAGWTPLLSFEATQALFEKEAEHAINVLYLDYWLREKTGGDLIKKVNVLKEIRKKTIEDIGNQRDQYQTLTDTINNNLKPQASQISHNIVAYQQELDARYVTIQENAEFKLKKQAEQAKILGGFKAVSSVLKLIPTPITQGIGYGMDVAANIYEENQKNANNDTTGTIKRIPEIADAFDKGYSSDNVKKQRQAWDSTVGDINSKANAINFDTPSSALSSVNGLKDSINSMGQKLKPISDLAEFTKPVKVSSEQLKATTDYLAANDPGSVELSNKINRLIEDKQKFAQQIAEAINATNTLQDTITQNVLALDGFNQDLIDSNKALDLETLQYIKEMANRANERLLKYHYWLAKAYQYRILDTYSNSLNLQALFDKMKAIAATSSDHTISAENFKNLKTIYDDILENVAEDILKKLSNAKADKSTPFSLSQYQINQLNAGQAIRVNLMRPTNTNDGFYPQEENIRIASIEAAIKSTSSNRFKIEVQHAGTSYIVKNGQSYYFEHYNKETQDPIVWRTEFNPSLAKAVNPEKPSLETASLLCSILTKVANCDAAPEKALLFSRPGGNADLIVSTTNNDPKLTDVTFTVSYSYDPVPSGKTQLILATDDGQDSNSMPLYKISLKDKNDRQNGLGTFVRNYDPNTRVNIEAPQKYGNVSFKQWIDSSNNDLGSNPMLSTSIKSSQKLIARYTTTSQVPTDSPTANFKTVVTGLNVNLDASESVAGASDRTITKYEWSSSDGQIIAGNKTSNITFKNSGDYTITLKITNDKSTSATKEQKVTVKANPTINNAEYNPDTNELTFKDVVVGSSHYWAKLVDQGSLNFLVTDYRNIISGEIPESGWVSYFGSTGLLTIQNVTAFGQTYKVTMQQNGPQLLFDVKNAEIQK